MTFDIGLTIMTLCALCNINVDPGLCHFLSSLPRNSLLELTSENHFEITILDILQSMKDTSFRKYITF